MKTSLCGMTTRYVKASTLALAFLTSLALNVEAKWTRYHALGCATALGSPSLQSDGLYNYSASSMNARCPITDTDSFMKGHINTLNVHGYNGNTNPGDYSYAMACATLWNTIGGSCGPKAFAYTVGDYTLKPSTSVWNSSTAADFGYLFVRIAGEGAGGPSRLRGYYTDSAAGQ